MKLNNEEKQRLSNYWEMNKKLKRANFLYVIKCKNESDVSRIYEIFSNIKNCNAAICENKEGILVKVETREAVDDLNSLIGTFDVERIIKYQFVDGWEEFPNHMMTDDEKKILFSRLSQLKKHNKKIDKVAIVCALFFTIVLGSIAALTGLFILFGIAGVSLILFFLIRMYLVNREKECVDVWKRCKLNWLVYDCDVVCSNVLVHRGNNSVSEEVDFYIGKGCDVVRQNFTGLSLDIGKTAKLFMLEGEEPYPVKDEFFIEDGEQIYFLNNKYIVIPENYIIPENFEKLFDKYTKKELGIKESSIEKIKEEEKILVQKERDKREQSLKEHKKLILFSKKKEEEKNEEIDDSISLSESIKEEIENVMKKEEPVIIPITDETKTENSIQNVEQNSLHKEERLENQEEENNNLDSFSLESEKELEDVDKKTNIIEDLTVEIPRKNLKFIDDSIVNEKTEINTDEENEDNNVNLLKEEIEDKDSLNNLNVSESKTENILEDFENINENTIDTIEQENDSVSKEKENKPSLFEKLFKKKQVQEEKVIEEIKEDVSEKDNETEVVEDFNLETSDNNLSEKNEIDNSLNLDESIKEGTQEDEKDNLENNPINNNSFFNLDEEDINNDNPFVEEKETELEENNNLSFEENIKKDNEKEEEDEGLQNDDTIVFNPEELEKAINEHEASKKGKVKKNKLQYIIERFKKEG